MQSGWVIIVVLLEASLVLCFVILNLCGFQHPPKAIESNKSFLKGKKKKKKGTKEKPKAGKLQCWIYKKRDAAWFGFVSLAAESFHFFLKVSLLKGQGVHQSGCPQ